MKNRKESLIYLMILLVVAGLSVIFISVMGYLNYRTSALELEEQVVTKIEKDSVSDLETAIGFGKSFENFYGMEEVFASFNNQIHDTIPFILGADGELMYYDSSNDTEAESTIQKFLSTREFRKLFSEMAESENGTAKKDTMRMILTPIHQDDNVIGYYGCLYSVRIFDDSFREVKRNIVFVSLLAALLEGLMLAIFVRVIKDDQWRANHRRASDRVFERIVILIIMGVSIVLLTGLTISKFQEDYMKKMEDSVEVSMVNLEDTIRRVQNQGVDLRKVQGLASYIEDRVSTLSVVRSVRVMDRISSYTRNDEASKLISYVIDIDEEEGTQLLLEAELSTEAAEREMTNILLVLLSTMIILMIFVFEMNNLIELFVSKIEKLDNTNNGFSEKQVGIALRFTGFLCSTAEYMCVPYAAMLIRDSGEALFGLSVGMTAALPLTMEGLMQMVGMMVLPRFVKKFNVRVILILSTLLMVFCNATAFAIGGALTIIICRAVAGFAYAGFKQVSNYLITKGYETEVGRSRNISQDNAGLLAGATCGAGLGAILSANTSYSMTFIFSACLFAIYLAATVFLLPWNALKQKTEAAEEEAKPVRFSDIRKIVFSSEMLFYILVIGIPLNIGVMLCVTLIPAICQTNGLSSVLLSYCYIANGLAGIYIGPSLVGAAKRYFGVPVSIAFAFILTAVSIFILRVPPLVMMIVITSMILGFLDGFGTPMCTDQFMVLNVVRNSVDESTALIISIVLSYVLLTIAPVIAELMLLPDRGVFSPMLLGAVIYAAAAVAVFLYGKRKTAQGA
ncbi:MAG: MFS transporter [Solobacterium sp.]|nr:MFS transporter [Solobacterium sp.]